eukprot:gene3863-7709_t
MKVVMIRQNPLGGVFAHVLSCHARRTSFSLCSARFPTEVPLSELLAGVENCEVQIKRPATLKNKYYGLRHGESEANIQGIISSDPVVGSTRHGLTASGKMQAIRSAQQIVDKVGYQNMDRVIFLTSYFKRAHQTASESLDAVRDLMYARQVEHGDIHEDLFKYVMRSDINFRKELRERFFGKFDATVLVNYNKVWPIDLVDANNNRQGVESVSDVISRISRLINDLESHYENKIFVMASHADTLQIMQTFLAGEDPRKFSQYRFKNGEGVGAVKYRMPTYNLHTVGITLCWAVRCGEVWVNVCDGCRSLDWGAVLRRLRCDFSRGGLVCYPQLIFEVGSRSSWVCFFGSMCTPMATVGRG